VSDQSVSLIRLLWAARSINLCCGILQHFAGGGLSAIISRTRAQNLSLRELEREYIFEMLRRTGGNKKRAAEILGLDRKTLYRKLEEYRADGDSPEL